MSVSNFNIKSRLPFAHGQSFGKTGPYEILEGIFEFSVDPNNKHNESINDLELATTNDNGQVEFSSDFVILSPKDPNKGNGKIFFDILNRGRKTAIVSFNDPERPVSPSDPIDPGNGFLMRYGYTIVFCGWQPDVPPIEGLLGMQLPDALDENGDQVVGKIMCQFQCNQPTQRFMLSHNGHTPHPPYDINENDAVLTVRNLPEDKPYTIDRSEWSFVDEANGNKSTPEYILMPSGFKSGLMYQLVYTTKGSKIIGLGMAAVRDAVSFLKYGTKEEGNEFANSLKYAFAYGRSQSGRFLREFINVAINEDENGRMALDGIIAHVAGGLRGEFNIRFGQPSQDICYSNPQLFPACDVKTKDPVSGIEAGLLDSMHAKNQQIPKIMFINTSSEYWRGDAALIHVNLENMTDLPDSNAVRRYLFSGAQHVPGYLPLKDVRDDGVRGQLQFNILDYSPLLRAALFNLDIWVSNNVEAPQSCHPRLSDGTAVESFTLAEKFSSLQRVKFPPQPLRALRLDHGQDVADGILSILPPVQGETYPALVSDVDDNFNDISGIRLPHISVPLATYAGWNLRHAEVGNENLYIGITGGLAGWTLPLPSTAEERLRLNDPRKSIEERYLSKEDYLNKINEASEALAQDRYLLPEDIDTVKSQAEKNFEHLVN